MFTDWKLVQWRRLLVVDKVLTDSLQSTLVFAVIKNLVIGFQNFDTFWNIYFLTLETWNSYQVTRAELPVVPGEPLRLTAYDDRPSILAYVQQGNIDVIDEKSQCRFPKSRSR